MHGRVQLVLYIYIYIYIKVYLKLTNRNDYIYFYSHHNNKTKTGLIIGFYLGALRIGSPQYLDEEFEYIKNSFKKPKIPKDFHIKHLKKKLLRYTHQINLRKTTPPFPSHTSLTHNPTISITHITNRHNKALYNKLTQLRIPIIQTTSQTIKNLTSISK